MFSASQTSAINPSTTLTGNCYHWEGCHSKLQKNKTRILIKNELCSKIGRANETNLTLKFCEAKERQRK